MHSGGEVPLKCASQDGSMIQQHHATARFALPGIRLASLCLVCGQRQRQQPHSKPAPAAPLKCASQDGSMIQQHHATARLRHRPSNTARLRHCLIAATHPGPPLLNIMSHRINPRSNHSQARSLTVGASRPRGLIRQTLCVVAATAGSAATDAPPPLVPRCWHRCPSALSVRERHESKWTASRFAPTTPPTTTTATP